MYGHCDLVSRVVMESAGASIVVFQADQSSGFVPVVVAMDFGQFFMD
jgi:hypothetical protein